MKNIEKLRLAVIGLLNKVKALKLVEIRALEVNLLQAVTQIEVLYKRSYVTRSVKIKEDSEKEVFKLCETVQNVMYRMVRKLKRIKIPSPKDGTKPLL